MMSIIGLGLPLLAAVVIVTGVHGDGQVAAAAVVESGVERQLAGGVDDVDVQLDALLRLPVVVGARDEHGEVLAGGDVRATAGQGVAVDDAVGSGEVAVRVDRETGVEGGGDGAAVDAAAVVPAGLAVRLVAAEARHVDSSAQSFLVGRNAHRQAHDDNSEDRDDDGHDRSFF